MKRHHQLLVALHARLPRYSIAALAVGDLVRRRIVDGDAPLRALDADFQSQRLGSILPGETDFQLQETVDCCVRGDAQASQELSALLSPEQPNRPASGYNAAYPADQAKRFHPWRAHPSAWLRHFQSPVVRENSTVEAPTGRVAPMPSPGREALSAGSC